MNTNKRTNKELKFDVSPYFKLKIGTVNKYNPISFYINGSAWITPLSINEYDEKLSHILYNFKKDILKSLSTIDDLSNKYILNFEAKTGHMKLNKKAYINFELYLKQINKIKDLKQLKIDITDNMTVVFNNLKDNIMSEEFNIN